MTERRITDRHLLALGGMEAYATPTETEFWEAQLRHYNSILDAVLAAERDMAEDTRTLWEELELAEAERHTKTFEKLWEANKDVLLLYMDKMIAANKELNEALLRAGKEPCSRCTWILARARDTHFWNWEVAHDTAKTKGLMAEISGDEAYGVHELFDRA